jgi:hypothetical protein
MLLDRFDLDGRQHAEHVNTKLKVDVLSSNRGVRHAVFLGRGSGAPPSGAAPLFLCDVPRAR